MPDKYIKSYDDGGYVSGEFGPSSTIGFEAPWVEQYRRGFFDNLTNLTRDPMPTPQRGVAGLDPFEMKARSLSGGLGGFQPYLQQAGGAYGQGLGPWAKGCKRVLLVHKPTTQAWVRLSLILMKIKWCKNLLMMCTKISHNKTCRQDRVQ